MSIISKTNGRYISLDNTRLNTHKVTRMSLGATLHKLSTEWSILFVIFLCCCITGKNAQPTCNESYFQNNFTEPTSRMDIEIIDLGKFCTFNDSVLLAGNDTQFVLRGNRIFCTDPDAEARLSTDPSIYANPWTITATMFDLDGNFTILTVFVRIKSINDNSPTITGLSIPNITDNTPVGTIVGGCTLTDADYPGSGDDIPYVEISTGNDDNKFVVDRDTCEVRLREAVNANIKSTYNLTFRAFNFPTDANATFQNLQLTIIPVSIYPPICSPLNIFLGVREDTPPNTVLTSLNCTDSKGNSDNVIFYRGAASSIPQLDVNYMGNITLDTALTYDKNVPANNTKMIVVLVTQSDNSTLQTSATIMVQVLDVDDHVPEFTPNVFKTTISIKTIVGTPVLNVTATDMDAPNTANSKITYGFESTCTPDCFLIDGSTGSIYVRKDIPAVSIITCTVFAYSSDQTANKSFANVSVTVINDNNFPPVFSQAVYEKTVPENSGNGTSVLDVKATDPENGTLTYSFPPGNTPPDWPCSIDALSGTVILRSPIDYETKANYTTRVVVTDNGVPTKTSTAVIVLRVSPKNEYTPVLPAMIIVDVDKTAPPGFIVTQITATDGDEGADGELEYSLENPITTFVIEKDTGILCVGIGLDKVNDPFVDVIVRVADKSENDVKSNTMTVRVNLKNVNSNNDPVCSPLGPLYVTPNNPNVGNPVGYFKCSDKDPNTNFRYDILSGDYYNLFEVTFNGTIRLKTIPIPGSYLVVFLISDQGAPARTVSVTVQINVQTELKFVNLPTTIAVYENASVTDLLFIVKATGAYDLINYEIISGNSQGLFHIQQSTGEIRLAGTLDREIIDSYKIQIQAKANNDIIEQSCYVSVLDINDNAPTFSSSVFFLSISETLPPNSKISQYVATDRDIGTNAEIVYSILSGNSDNVFRYDATGNFFIAKTLDFRKQAFYTLFLLASDKGVPSLNNTAILNIQVLQANNTNIIIAPSGGNIFLPLPENTAIGTPIIQIYDQNNGSDLNFTIINGNNGKNFTIGQSTGVVSLTFALDREWKTSISIVIQVSDKNGKTNITNLSINITDINDNNPVCNPPNATFRVPHGTSPGSNIGTLAVTDPDMGVNQEVTLSIISGDPGGMFTFNGATLQAKAVLNANVNNIYQLLVLIRDHGSPSLNSTAIVIVIVLPEFKRPWFIPKMNITSVEETRRPGSLLYDADATFYGAAETTSTNAGDLLYSLTSGDTSTFAVEKLTGIVQLKKALNYSTNTFYTLTITASNKYNLSLTDSLTLQITVIQVNRYSPVFLSSLFYWNVMENASLGAAVGKVSATDDDPGEYGKISYDIDPDTYFIINATTGIVRLVRALEYSIVKSRNLIVTATDHAGINSRTTLGVIVINVIDVNNWVPNFINGPYYITIRENLSIGTVIAILYAKDLDSGAFGTVMYSILSGNYNGIFTLNSTTGQLSIKVSPDYESSHQYVLLVQANDGGTPPLSNTTIVAINILDENDNAPVFTNNTTEFTIPSDIPPLTTIGTVHAVDYDSGINKLIKYTIQDSNSYKWFGIDAYTGTIKTEQLLTSAGSFQKIIVLAIDQGKPSLTGTVAVSITIRPVQSPTPGGDYEFSVKENQGAGTYVGNIAKSTSFNNITGYTIRSGNIGNAFAIQIDVSQNGVIKTMIVLDREYCAYYQLVVTVTGDRGSIDVTVTVKVIDLNDNSPVFDKNVLNIQLVENAPPGLMVGQLFATDADEGVNSQIDIFMSPATPPGSVYFLVDGTGVITVQREVSYEVTSSISFTVLARDRGTPSRSSTATVNVFVTNVNETIKKQDFETASFTSCDFPDDAAEGDVVCSLSPKNVGVTMLAGDIARYDIVGRESVFNVHPSTGYLLVSKKSLIFSDTRYAQWVIITITSGLVTTSHALIVRLDTFNKKNNLISVNVNTDLLDLQSKQDGLRANIQNVFNPTQSVVIWGTQSASDFGKRRRLLASGSQALVVVEADNSTNDVSNIGKPKTFLTTAEALKKMQKSDDGTPVDSLASSNPAVTSVQPYVKDEDDDLDPAYIALIVVGSIFALALIVGLIALIIYCACYRRVKNTDKKRLVEKKKQSKKSFGNIEKPRLAGVQPKPAAKTIYPDDPDSDGMPIRPTTATFISSSNTPLNTSNARPHKNSSTMLESLEEKNEDEIMHNTSSA